MAQAVKVMVRCRPMNTKQKQRGCVNVVQVDFKNNQINLVKQDNNQPPKSFSYDRVFGADSPQSLIYQQSAFSLVDSVLDGYNGTIFAYGQTGCGKTHTMMGVPDNQQLKGIIPRTFGQIITVTKNDVSKTHLICCSFIQIYNQQIHDLLGKDIKARMELKQSPDKGIFVKDLSRIRVDSIAQMQKYMEMGFKNRATRATNMNAQSSRSHSIFSIYIDSQQQDDKGNQKYKASKLNLVDLAGSQRASKTGATGDGMKQATKINLSLSALGNVISALVDGKTHHIPYRDSKLTRLLQDSLGGNTKTIMIAAVSPANYNYDETLSTLRYASRAKFIQNKPKINEDPKDALLREYMQEIKKLKMMLEGKVPINMTNLQSNIGGGSPVVQQKIVYRDIQNKQNNTGLEQQLRNKENLLLQEQQQKRILKQKLENLQKVFNGPSKGPDRQDKDELQKIKKLKQKLKAQKKKQQQYQKQKQRREQQLLNIQKNYKNLNQQVDEVKQRFAQIKKKYIANLTQLRDIQNQHEDQKQELLDTIRYQQKQIKKFSAILNMLMSSDQIDMIVNNSQWDQQKRQWKVPYFTYRQKNVNLPKLMSKQMTKDMIETQKQKKQLFFRNSKRDNNKKTSPQDGFKLNNIVQNARRVNQFDTGNQGSRTTNVINRAHLTPLKNESYEKAERVYHNLPVAQDKRKRTTNQRLDPIPIGGDSRKYL